MKIGILSKYYNNFNYGGLLQAYALFKKFNNISNSQTAYLISYNSKGEYDLYNSLILKKNKLSRIFRIKREIKYTYINIKYKKLFSYLDKRKKFFYDFQNMISHTEKIYSKENVEITESLFDVFVSGSDQIWNSKWHNDAFYLTFVSNEKLKIAYAASMGVSEIRDEVADKIIPLINKFDYVSVREKSAKEIIDSYTDKEVTVVSDPVLLLNQDDWNDVAVSPMADKNYVYTYLLGDRKDNRDITTKIAKEMSLPLVTVPYIRLKYNDYDKSFGDIQLNEVGPAEFVGLIRDSKMVVTDSFHAIVFSLIYNKKFVALKRNLDTETGSMNSRITDLLEEMGLSDRIVESLDEITEELLSKEIDFTNTNRVINEKKIISIEFLKKAFTGTEMEQSLTGYLEKLKEEN